MDPSEEPSTGALFDGPHGFNNFVESNHVLFWAKKRSIKMLAHIHRRFAGNFPKNRCAERTGTYPAGGASCCQHLKGTLPNQTSLLIIGSVVPHPPSYTPYLTSLHFIP